MSFPRHTGVTDLTCRETSRKPDEVYGVIERYCMLEV